MSFKLDWHSFDVARHWPTGSVVALRMKLNAKYHHKHTYVLINNWQPANPAWARPNNAFILLEEPTKG